MSRVPEVCRALDVPPWVCTDVPYGLPCEEAWLHVWAPGISPEHSAPCSVPGNEGTGKS